MVNIKLNRYKKQCDFGCFDEEHALEITANVMGQLCEIFRNSIMYKWPLILAVMRSETTELGDCRFADKKL